MKKHDPLLHLKLAQTKQQLYLTEIALRHAINGRLPVFHDIYLSEHEQITFHLLEPDQPHGGILVIRQRLTPPDVEPTETVLVQFLDDFHSHYMRRQHLRAFDQWQKVCHQVERKLRRAA